MASISERESREIEAANASGTTPVVFIHGLWLLPSSWAAWADFFEQAGYAPLTPDWPDDPESIEAARAEPEVLAGKTLKQVADHTTDVIKALDRKPVIMGHSTGGLLAQMLAGRGLAAATVAIDPGVFRGVLPLPAATLRSAGPFLIVDENDVLRDEGEAYARRLLEAGVPVTTVRYNAIIHDFMMLNPLRSTQATTAAVEQAIHVLRQALGTL